MSKHRPVIIRRGSHTQKSWLLASPLINDVGPVNFNPGLPPTLLPAMADAHPGSARAVRVSWLASARLTGGYVRSVADRNDSNGPRASTAPTMKTAVAK